MNSRNRMGVLALVGALSVPVVVAAVAWACSPSGYGTPESPPPPPTSTVQPTPSTTSAPQAVAQPPASPVQVQVNTPGTATNTTGSVIRAPKKVGSDPARTVAPGRSVNTGAANLTARLNGATAGVVKQGSQKVFASSAPPRRAAARSEKSAARTPARKAAPAISERTATSDLWSAVTGSNPSLASAASSADTGGGLSGLALAGIAMLGLTLAAIAGGALVSVGSRRRTGARTPR